MASGDPVEYREDAARSFKLGSMKLLESNNGKRELTNKEEMAGGSVVNWRELKAAMTKTEKAIWVLENTRNQLGIRTPWM